MTKNNPAVPHEGQFIEEKNIVQTVESQNDVPAEIFANIYQEIASYHQGPIPSPEQLAEYKRLDPSLVDRILTMSEKALDANNNQKNADAYYKRKQADAINSGQFLIFFILIFTIAGSLVLGYLDKTWSSGGIAALAAVLSYFIWKPQKTKKSE